MAGVSCSVNGVVFMPRVISFNTSIDVERDGVVHRLSFSLPDFEHEGEAVRKLALSCGLGPGSCTAGEVVEAAVERGIVAERIVGVNPQLLGRKLWGWDEKVNA